MPPKSKSQAPKTANGTKPGPKKDQQAKEERSAPIEQPPAKSDPADADADASSTTSTKRKRGATSHTDANKAPRRSGRGATSTTKPSVAPAKLLSYLLSPACAPLSRPSHETDALNENPKLRTYTNTVPLSPFEELVASVILSRPISHALGQRSVRTLLNPPYGFRTPKAISEAGSGKVHEMLEQARTQHKAKTAEQVVGLAAVVVEKGWCTDAEDVSMQGLRGMIEGDDVVGTLRGLLKEIKGLGDTGVDIFVRRVQGVWAECAPFVDGRTKASVEKLGLSDEGSELRKLIDEHWGQLEKAELGGNSDDEKKLHAFVLLLERAVGADLEGNMDEVLEAAGKS